MDRPRQSLERRIERRHVKELTTEHPANGSLTESHVTQRFHVHVVLIVPRPLLPDHGHEKFMVKPHG